MMELFFDRSDDRGCNAVFVGKFDKLETLLDYCFSKYMGDDYTEEEFQLKFEEMFLPENANREVEDDFREHFSAGMLNQFSYDFAVVFDEDSAGADVRNFHTKSLRELLVGSRIYRGEVEEIIADFEKRDIVLPEECNAFCIIPTIYEGYYSHVKKENMEIWYLGTYRP